MSFTTMTLVKRGMGAGKTERESQGYGQKRDKHPLPAAPCTTAPDGAARCAVQQARRRRKSRRPQMKEATEECKLAPDCGFPGAQRDFRELVASSRAMMTTGRLPITVFSDPSEIIAIECLRSEPKRQKATLNFGFPKLARDHRDRLPHTEQLSAKDGTGLRKSQTPARFSKSRTVPTYAQASARRTRFSMGAGRRKPEGHRKLSGPFTRLLRRVCSRRARR